MGATSHEGLIGLHHAARLGDTSAVVSLVGAVSSDVYLNDRAYRRNVPVAVWTYRLGGYQVLKKWLSYRESMDLGPHRSQMRFSTSLIQLVGLPRFWSR